MVLQSFRILSVTFSRSMESNVSISDIKTGSTLARGRLSLIRDAVCRFCFRNRCLPGQGGL